MLKIYGSKWCPHCTKTVEYLQKNNIEFEYFEIEKQAEKIVRKEMVVMTGLYQRLNSMENGGKVRFLMKKSWVPIWKNWD